jgi:predicted nucleotidyltransferase component of viral defense system
VPNYHEDTGLFREALIYTQSDTGFSARLIEKDYYCSLVLIDLAGEFERGVVFKGGTCLSKVHTDFYRLSEDLDFAIATRIDATRGDRRIKVAPLKQHFARLPERYPCFGIGERLRGFNLHRQYIGRYSYRSVVTGQDEFIKVEIGMREPIVDPVEQRPARTMLTDPFRNEPALALFSVTVLSSREAYAEKCRAALTRREPAIRDFYDIDHAVRTAKLDPLDAELHRLVGRKLVVPGNDPIDVREEKLATLARQLEPQLKPVLRARDFEDFDLERAFSIVARIAETLGRRS